MVIVLLTLPFSLVLISQPPTPTTSTQLTITITTINNHNHHSTNQQDIGPLLVSRLSNPDYCYEEDFLNSETSYPLLESVYALQVTCCLIALCVLL